MTEKEARRIGGKQGLICAMIGLLIAHLIMVSFEEPWEGFFRALVWFTEVDYKLNLLVGVIIMLLCGFFYGAVAGKAILIRKWDFRLVGFLCGMAVLLTTAFLSGWMGFFREGNGGDGFEDYVLKPFYLVTMFGVIPASIVGLWLG